MAKPKAEPNLERFNLNQRIQHAILAVTCLVLFVTGLTQKFGDDLGYLAILIGGYSVTTAIHRFAGAAIIVLMIYHSMYFIFDRTWWRSREMLPRPSDIIHPFQDTFYIFGLTDKAKYRKYAYREKIDYWGTIIFFPILIFTGFFMWFPSLFVAYIAPADYLPALFTIHTMDAILAGFALMLHQYNVHLSPGFFPANWTMFTGQISPERAEEEFPEWYEKRKEEGRLFEKDH